MVTEFFKFLFVGKGLFLFLMAFLTTLALIISLIHEFSSERQKRTADARRESAEKELKEKTEENLRLSQKNVELLEKNYAMITGGDSFPYLMPIDFNFSTNRQFLFMNHGFYPLFGLKIRVWDEVVRQELREKRKHGEFDQTHHTKGIYDFPEFRQEIPAHTQAYVTLSLPIPDDAATLKYTFQMQAKNGVFTEQLRMQRYGDKSTWFHWAFAARVQDEHGKVLKEEIAPEIKHADGPVFDF